ncbi:mandelate racemase/muconate lactonizing enzyme family protein [Paenibacillus agricola]|uniref:Mandelate racemase/muconate lactonizing enzyme family protein n=1 Tax=Paenibacillus agricola TaxID=2716264 RepID=A0ABX0J420_9BACL|nr:mandelate racemase/muconate lactonizing enzyme family protein [Paenibacillus agricola]NHN29854.1 mandelate racemase/muconate lactonizing enzyme family protein [Paenibacillus agricola]
MKITSIETFTFKQLSFVRVTSEDGLQGYGQIAPYQANISALVLHQQIAPHALGADCNEIHALSEVVIREEHKFPGSYICRALGGLDTALWDLKGKRLGKGVCELLGGQPRMVEVYGSSMQRGISPEQEAERLKRLKETQGYRAFKIRIANNFGNDVDVYPGRSEQVVKAVRAAIGDDTLLYVDANSGLTPGKAIETGRMLAQYGVCHFEEPCPYMELEWTKQVADALDIPVTGGEQDTDLAQFRRMIGMRAVDIVQPDICYVGGLSRALEVAKMADSVGMVCTPHAANLSMLTIFTLHMVAAIPNAGKYMEYTIEQDAWTDNLFTQPLVVSDGKVQVPEGPGWGVTIRPEWLDRAEYQISKYTK